MNKKCLKITFIGLFALALGYNYFQTKSEGNMSDILLQNLEALASSGESSGGKAYVNCSGTDIICVGSGSFTCCK